MLLLYILLALLGQQTTVNCQQTPFLESEKGCEQRAMSNEPFSETEKSVNISEICGNEKTNHKLVQKKSEKGSEPQAMSNEQRFRKAQSSQLEAQSLKKTVDCCPLTVDYFENQIRLADSLYKNYLPQYNFEEVKAAVMFFDSLRLTTDNSQRTTDSSESEKRLKAKDKSLKISVAEPVEAPNDGIVPSTSSGTAYPKTVDCCPLTVDIEYQRARAHYYHAVGLTERDDIVGACEHYFIALEIMEPLVETSPLWRLMTKDKYLMANGERLKSQVKENAHSSKLEAQSPDYEKIRLIALTYTRLGSLFLNENYCDLAMLKYKRALKYCNIINDTISISYTYKNIGNVYQLLDKTDSALYHYRRSLEIYSGLTNKLDIEKSIAQILFEKGERDSAYTLIKNNLDKLDNYSQRDSYYATFGEMYYMDKVYDSAIFYLEKSVESQNYYTKQLSSQKLSAIYDSIGDYEKKAYYDNIILDLSVKGIKRSVKNNQLQDVYDKYKERKVEKERAINKKRTKLIVITFTVILILSFAATLFIRYIYKRKQEDYINSIKEKDENLLEKDIIIKQIESEIKEYHKEIEDNKLINKDKDNLVSLAIECLEMRKKEISDKEKIIRKQQKELANINHNSKSSLSRYYDSEICKIILSKKEIEYAPLSIEELTSLLESANNNLGGIIDKLNLQYPQLDKDDMCLICLILLHINKSGLPYLLNRSRKNIWERTKRIKTIMNIGEKEDLFLFIKINLL